MYQTRLYQSFGLVTRPLVSQIKPWLTLSGRKGSSLIAEPHINSFQLLEEILFRMEVPSIQHAQMYF